MQNGKILRTNRLAGLFALLMNLSVAEFLVQGSYSMQVNDTITRMSGYDVKYSDVGSNVSPYDISLGYMFSFRDVAVMPVMVEGKTTTIESYLNPTLIIVSTILIIPHLIHIVVLALIVPIRVLLTNLWQL